jgi:hypothetical protein
MQTIKTIQSVASAQSAANDDLPIARHLIDPGPHQHPHPAEKK